MQAIVARDVAHVQKVHGDAAHAYAETVEVAADVERAPHAILTRVRLQRQSFQEFGGYGFDILPSVGTPYARVMLEHGEADDGMGRQRLHTIIRE